MKFRKVKLIGRACGKNRKRREIVVEGETQQLKPNDGHGATHIET
jgi:hypothetical protein